MTDYFWTRCWLLGLSLKIILLGPSIVHGQDVWQGSPTSSNWFTSSNWSLETPPNVELDATVDNGTKAQVTAPPEGTSTATVATLTIGATVGGSIVQLFGVDLHAGSVIVGPHGTFEFSGGFLTASVSFQDNGIVLFDTVTNQIIGGLSGSGQLIIDGIALTADGDNPFNGQTTINGTGSFQIGTGGTTGSIGGNIVDNGVLTFDRSDAVTFAGVISGVGSVIQLGTGTTILTGDNSYTGGTTISAGTLQIGNGGTTGSIVGNVIDNANLAFDRSDALIFAGDISGTGSVTQIGTGTTILSGNNTYTGGTTISAGILQIGNGGTTGRVVGNVIDNANLAFDRSDALIFAGDISGTGSVTQIGTGTTILSGNNTYTGGTTISAGTLQIGNGGTTGSIVGNVIDNANLAFDRSDALIFAGDISGTGSVTQIGTGTTILSGNNTYTGGTTISAGTLQIGNGGTTGSIVGNVIDNANLAFDRSDALIFAGDISGTGSVTQIGTGTTILSGDNTYTGGTTISAGILQIGNGGTTGSITGNVVDNGTLAFDRSDR